MEMMSNEEEKRCPLCAEVMDWTDQQLKPCKCGYQVCVWCWHQIMDMAERDETEGVCPACRTPYDKDKIVGIEAKFERVSNSANRKHKPSKAKPKTNEGRKDLTNVRVIQRKMAYVIGLPLSLADEDLLLRKEFFGQYGKVSKISLSRTAGGAVQQFVNDTCSVYITYSKEEEAIRCIQSVHGFVLEDRFLRASFGTAKYCHAWLRNMPCSNPACLYLHSVGADEDSFSKDEEAAAHTRNRVQQIVGAAHNLHWRSGNVLPPPIEEHFKCISASTEKPFFRSGLNDVAPDMVTSNCHVTYLPSPKDKDGGVRAPTKSMSFVDIVGRPSSSGSEKEGTVAEDRKFVDLCSEFTSVGIHKANHVDSEYTDVRLCEFSSSSDLVNGYTNKGFKESFREPSNLLALGKADSTPRDACGIKEQSCFVLDSEEQLRHGPYSVVGEDLLSLDDDEKLKDSVNLSWTACLLPSSNPVKTLMDSNDHIWRESHNLGDCHAHPNNVNNNVDEASIQFACAESTNDGYNEKKFQSSAKSDRIYRCSNSFSNEEIVEHLRRLKDDGMINDAQNPALDAVESSIISNIMSLNFDACDNLLASRPCVAGLFDQSDKQQGPLWNFRNSDQSVLSITKQDGFVNRVTDLDYSLGDIAQELKKCSTLQASEEIKEHYPFKPQYHGVSRAQGQTPPGFSLPSREPPPGFPACERTDQVFNNISVNHYRPPSAGYVSNTRDFSIVDPAITTVARSKPTNGQTNSFLDMRSTYTSQLHALDDEARLWLLMQQSPAARQDLKFSQTYMHQNPAAHQEPRYSGQIGNNGYTSWDDIYGISSRRVDQQQTNNSSNNITQFSQQKFANGNISNGYYQQGLGAVQQLRTETGMAELQSNELGYNKYYQGHGDYIMQMPSSGDIYGRVFGM